MKVAIELRTALDDQGQLEYHTTKAKGSLYQKGIKDVVIFEEDTEEGVIKNMLTIQSDKVSIKRTGAMTMHQQFSTERSTENVLRHPYGTIHMETDTQTIHYDQDAGHLTVDYAVKLNGQEPRQQQLEVLLVSDNGQEEER
ncbi:putative beta-barrel protein YwiB [Lentibacillus sp. JNUCC-1]|uniref:DUF1934 domain-containing protein n=1 Tax=Lentibacillus sp. JNUCC-1 TaxID=2654513 RepID=UPI0012E77553|nr:DUF1934 domain-containing protein [Lentibacillus sp. JNUCC-1]MUV37431.1 putative beta-barrel protein YwiB [Lentibacillus sp. JNUCC-1]